MKTSRIIIFLSQVEIKRNLRSCVKAGHVYSIHLLPDHNARHWVCLLRTAFCIHIIPVLICLSCACPPFSCLRSAWISIKLFLFPIFSSHVHKSVSWSPSLATQAVRPSIHRPVSVTAWLTTHRLAPLRLPIVLPLHSYLFFWFFHGYQDAAVGVNNAVCSYYKIFQFVSSIEFRQYMIHTLSLSSYNLNSVGQFNHTIKRKDDNGNIFLNS